MSALLRSPDPGNSVRGAARMIRGQLDMTFAVTPERMAAVRRVVRENLCWLGVHRDAVDRMVYVLNELLTNIVEHTQPDGLGNRMTSLLVHLVPEGLTAVVSDGDGRRPRLVAAGPTDECGRGLTLVAGMVDDSNVSMTDSGKDVWVYIRDASDQSQGLPDRPSDGLAPDLDGTTGRAYDP